VQDASHFYSWTSTSLIVLPPSLPPSLQPHLLLSAGLDQHLRLWDLRKAGGREGGSEPLTSYFGHVSSLVKKQVAITAPEFYDGGR